MSYPAFDPLLREAATDLAQLDEVVTQLADGDREQELASLLAERSCAPAPAAQKALGDAAERAIALLCRAAGLTLNGYSAVLRMRRRKRRGSGQDPAVLLSAYRGLPKLTGADLVAALQANAGRDGLG